MGREAVTLEVPMQVDLKFGRSWGDAKHTWAEFTGDAPAPSPAPSPGPPPAPSPTPSLRPSRKSPPAAPEQPEAPPPKSRPAEKPEAPPSPPPKAHPTEKPAPPPPITIALTKVTKIGGPLTKRISLAPDGTLISDGSACVMSKGTAERVKVTGVAALAALIESLAAVAGAPARHPARRSTGQGGDHHQEQDQRRDAPRPHRPHRFQYHLPRPGVRAARLRHQRHAADRRRPS